MKILFYGMSKPYDLCMSYIRAAQNLGLQYKLYDYEKATYENIPFGKFGLRLHQYLNFESWAYKINRPFVLLAREYSPDIIVTFTNAPITPAALIFIKSVLPHTKFVIIWPDSLLNFKDQTLSCLPLFDLIATYGSTSVNILSSIAKTQVEFIPLAGDLEIHGIAPSNSVSVDIGFVGGWRPERQKTFEIINHHFPGLKMEIHGPVWKNKCKASPIATYIKGDGLRGMDMARFFNSTLINVNTIDDTNYPSANMRFFEIMTAGGLELVSACPEMEDLFFDRKDLLYFKDESTIVEQIQWVLDNSNKIEEIKFNGYSKIIDKHNYTVRLKTIIKHCL